MNMVIRNNYKTTEWSGGKTTELFIYPEGSDYQKGCFTARVSSATVETETSDFTKLKGVYRMLMVLEGEMDLSIKDNEAIKMRPYDICAFWGDWETKSRGKVRDFNLMVKSNMEGDICLLSISQHNTMNFKHSWGKQLLVIYIVDGKGTLNGDAVESNDTIVIEDYQGESIALNNLGEDYLKLAVCHIWEKSKP